MRIKQIGKISAGMILVLILSSSCGGTRYATDSDSQRKSLMLKQKTDYSARKPKRRSVKSQRKSLMLPKHPERSGRKMKRKMRRGGGR